MWNEIRKTFFAGLLVLAPMALTIYVLYLLFGLLDGILAKTIIQYVADKTQIPIFQRPIPGLGIVFLVSLIFIVGAIAKNYMGRKIFEISDYIVTKIPIMNRIYVAIRQISEAIFSEKREMFKKAVLFEYPRKGIYSIGFFTQDTKGPVQHVLADDVVSVFVPTTPNPTSGYLLFVPKEQVIELKMSVEDAMKLIISAGAIHLQEGKGLESFVSKKIKSKSEPLSK